MLGDVVDVFSPGCRLLSTVLSHTGGSDSAISDVRPRSLARSCTLRCPVLPEAVLTVFFFPSPAPGARPQHLLLLLLQLPVELRGGAAASTEVAGRATAPPPGQSRLPVHAEFHRSAELRAAAVRLSFKASVVRFRRNTSGTRRGWRQSGRGRSRTPWRRNGERLG